MNSLSHHAWLREFFVYIQYFSSIHEFFADSPGKPMIFFRSRWFGLLLLFIVCGRRRHVTFEWPANMVVYKYLYFQFGLCFSVVPLKSSSSLYCWTNDTNTRGIIIEFEVRFHFSVQSKLKLKFHLFLSIFRLSEKIVHFTFRHQIALKKRSG